MRSWAQVVSSARRAVCAAALSGVFLTGFAADAAAQGGALSTARTYDQFVREANANTVTVVAGGPGDTSLFVANDLSTVLRCVNGLRVIPFVGSGDASNVYDLLFLRGADLAIVPADVLDHIAETARYTRNLRDRVVFIAPLYSEEVHLVVSDRIESIEELDGKFVNMGPPGALGLAASKILAQAGVTAIESKFDTALAIERLIDGRLDAVFIKGGKPVPALAQISGMSGLKLLPLPALADTPVYTTASFSHEDYPDLVRAGDTVETIAVPSVLAGYDWPADHPRYAKTRLFTETLFERLPYLRRPARHAKWGDADLTRDVPGWRRFAPAEPIVASLRRPEPVEVAATGGSAAPAAPGLSEARIEELFEARLREFGIAPRNEDERALLLDAFKRRLQAGSE